ncbi:uncharacterized protein FTJAE_3127 [Fusarium tjaetaba]|uniref:Uncharacterized protein n=1 Tax=Fusarium tjaetaba TaxID=1567544 RepID=A0A8H5S327_9HYPO|nr:uncharacterized protein FTJAE_3127 [Fusarium tjaetaba]KAF5643710.1 hypothetical protein FTJAE_3127 [Fusarium tjaetaba]
MQNSPRSGSFERRSSVHDRMPSPSPIRSPLSRSRIPSPSRGRSQAPRGRPSSRMVSRSKSRARLSSRSSSRSPSPSRRSKRSDNHHHHGLFKTTAGLLAGIGVAAVVAHKVWPKGVLYGDHEDWEHSSKHHRSDRPHHRRRRSLENGERVVERTARRRGDAVYYEEVDRRRPQDFERMPRPEYERMRQPAERLPYPADDHYTPAQPVYAERRRTVVQPAPMHPEW